jgi:hypothetical protein
LVFDGFVAGGENVVTRSKLRFFRLQSLLRFGFRTLELTILPRHIHIPLRLLSNLGLEIANGRFSVFNSPQ